MKKLQNAVLFILATAFAYALAEGIYSSMVVFNLIERETIWFTEETDSLGNLRFDDQIGYRISSIPSRWGAVTWNGQLESIGVLKGNDMGFPDDRDFSSSQKDDTITRIAVMGDSYTASQFTSRSWLKCFEDSLNKTFEDSVELWNLAIDGGGLANWREVLDKVVFQRKLNVDAIIYAVFGNDLIRTFHYRHHYRLDLESEDFETGAIAIGYHDNWNPESYPDDIPRTMGFLSNYIAISTEDADKIENGEWKFQRSWNFYFFLRLRSLLIFTLAGMESSTDITSAEKLKLINQMKLIHDSLDVPVLVLSFEAYNADAEAHKMFANIIGADHLRENIMYHGGDNSQHRIIGDGHWTDKGVEFFAKNNHSNIVNWLSSNGLLGRQKTFPGNQKDSKY